jgi:hypothetical protein
MVSVSVVSVFVSKIVDNQTEVDVSHDMGPQASGVGAWGESMGSKMFDELLVCQDACLGQAVRVTGDLEEDKAVVNEIKETILVNDGLRDGGDGNSPIRIAWHGGAEVESFEVKICKPHTGSQDDAVEKDIDGGNVSGGGADFYWVIYQVTANGKAYAFCFLFVRAFGGDKTCICGLATWQQMTMVEVRHRLGSGGHVGQYIFGEAFKFIGGAVEL